MKRKVSLILVFSLCISMFLGMGITAEAASRQLPTINSFTQNISAAQYKVLRTGSYTAEKRSGVWYYRFSTKNEYVLVKAAAFSGGIKNDFTTLSSQLTKGVASTKSSTTPSLVYKIRRTSSTQIVLGRDLTKKTQNTKYKTDLVNLGFYSSVSGTNVTLRCEKKDHVLFEYTSYVKPERLGMGSYVKPSTAFEYKRALTRTTSGSSGFQFTPQFTLSVDRAGTNCVVLKEYCYKIVGDKQSNTDVNKLISVAFTTGKVVAGLSAGSLPVKDLFDLFGKGAELVKKKSEWSMTKYYPLSNNGKKVMQARFKSPIVMLRDKDYFEINLHLSDLMSVKGTKTVLSVTFKA